MKNLYSIPVSRVSKLLMIIVLFLGGMEGFGQLSVNSLPYVPAAADFNLYNPSTSADLTTTIPFGWTASSSSVTPVYNGQGTGNGTGGYWGFGISGDFSLGALRSGTPENITYTVSYINNSGSTITDLTMAWNYEQWRYANTSGWNCTGTGQLSSNVILNSKDFSGTATGTNGTVSSTQISSFTLTGLSILDGQTFGISWITTDPTGADNSISLDDFSILAIGSPAAPLATISDNGTQTGTQNIFTGTTGNVISKARVVTSNGPLDITSMNFVGTAASTYVAADISAFKLYRSTLSTYDGTATLIQSISSSKVSAALENITFSTSQNSLANGTYFYYLIADISSGAISGRNINIATFNSITVTGGASAGSASAAGPTTILGVPVVTAASQNGFTNNTFSYNILATNNPTSYAIASGTLPPGLSLNTTTGQISGTPIIVGSYSVDVTATNGAGTSTAATISFTISAGSSASDYFQSNTISGVWTTPASWQSSPTGFAPWMTATSAPTTAAAGINILSGHVITLTSTVTIDKTTVSGTLKLLNDGNVTSNGGLTLNNGGGSDELTISNGGQLQIVVSTSSLSYDYGSKIIYGTSGNINVQSGGKITIGDGTNTHTGKDYWKFGTETSSRVNWNNSSIFNWNTTSVESIGTSLSQTYFPSAGAGIIPILRFVVSTTGTTGSGGNVTINGVLEINSPMTFSGAGSKTFRNGIRGTSTFTQSGTGTFIISSSSSAVLDGTLNLVLNTSGLMLSSGVEVPLGANVKVSGGNITNSNGTFLVNGTIDVTTINISNPAASQITVNGTLKTANTNGLTGVSGGTIGNTTSTGGININTGSTIDYNAIVNQPVTTRTDYKNLTLSGSGTKTISGAFNPTGTVYITGSAICDVASNTFGNSNTNLTMDGTSRLRLQGNSSAKPDIDGTYILTSGTIEYYSSQIGRQTIKGKTAGNTIDILYKNIEITGNNVGNSITTIKLNSTAGNLTVKNGGNLYMSDIAITPGAPVNTSSVGVETGGIFSTGSNKGFSGFPTGFSDNSSIHSDIAGSRITLNTGSTVDYYGTSAQLISNEIPYQNLTLSSNAAVSKTAPSGVLSILGNLSKTGTATFAHNSGTVSFDGTVATTQTYSANDSMNFYKVIINNSNGGVTVGSGTMGVEKLFTFNESSKLFFTAGYISIRSSAAGTAAIDKVPTTASVVYTGNGRFRIERYVGYNRKWHLLSIPTTEDILTSTFKTNWQENSATANDNLVTNYGMQITNNGSVAGGFDAVSPGGPSVKYYIPGSDSYLGISATTDPIATPTGYYAFVRGDRLSLNSNTVNNPTRLRSTGKIITGDKTVTVPDLKYEVIGNPYASAVDLRTLGFTGTTGNTAALTGNVYVWDPTIAGTFGLGKYVLLSYASGNYIADNSTGLYNSTTVTNFIQSGQAFFAQSTGSGSGVTFHENDKTTGSNTVSFTNGTAPMLRISMYTLNDGINANGADGAVALFGNDMNNALDNGDALKMLNTTDNLALKTGGKLIGIERRQTIESGDTLRLDISRMRNMKYRFIFSAANLSAPGLTGYLIDRFANTSAEINLSGNTEVNFVINNDPLSYAAERFMIVFKTASVVPVTFTGITATRVADGKVAVKWTAENEVNTDRYEIEHSADGITFRYVSSENASNNTGGSAAYSYVDAQALRNENYYRIKSIGQNGEAGYSAVAKVGGIRSEPVISIFPNPISDGVINLKMINISKGNYAVSVINGMGQIVKSETIVNTDNNFMKSIKIEQNSPAGNYSVIITGPEGRVTTLPVIIE